MRHVFRLSLPITACLMLFSSGCRNEHLEESGKKLMNAFKNACRSGYGPWTETALEFTDSLVGALEEAKNNPQCEGLASALNESLVLRDQIARMNDDPLLTNYREAVEQRNEVMLLIESAAADPSATDELTALREKLYEVELSIAYSQASVSASRHSSQRSRLVDGLQGLTGYLSAILKQSAGLQKCYQNSPYAAAQLASSALAVGGLFASPALGGALSSVGELLSELFNFLSTNRIEQTQLDLKMIKLQKATECAVEAHVNLYCDGERTMRLIKLASDGQRSQNNGWEAKGIWRGMDLMGRKLPVVNAWLNKVVGGVQPSNYYDASRRNAIRRKFEGVGHVRSVVQGYINETARLIATTGDRSRITGAFKSIYLNVGGNEAVNSLGYSQIRVTCRLYTKDTDLSACETSLQSIANDFSIERAMEILKVEDLNITSLAESAYAFLDELDQITSQELFAEISINSRQVIVEASRPQLRNDSPKSILEQISKYLKESAKYFEEHPRDGSELYISNALAHVKKIDRVVERLNHPETDVPFEAIPPDEDLLDKPGDDDSDSVKPNTCNELYSSEEGRMKCLYDRTLAFVFREFQLIVSAQVITTNLQQLIQWDIEKRILEGDVDDELSRDLIASGIGLSEHLESIGVSLRHQARIVTDIGDAQTIVQENLNKLFEVIAGSLDEGLKKMDAMAKENGEPYGASTFESPHRNRLARICLLILTSTSKWPEGINIKTCQGTMFIPGVDQNRLFLAFDEVKKQLESEPNRKKRMCIYPEFFREIELFQVSRGRTGWKTNGYHLNPLGLVPPLLEPLRTRPVMNQN